MNEETEVQKALRLCIRDAHRRELGVRASTTPYGPLVAQIRRDMERARELNLWEPPFYTKYYLSGSSESLPRFRSGEVEFIPSSVFAFTSISVAGDAVYYDSGIGGSGSYACMTLGGSMLPGIWWDDITEAAKALSDAIANGEAALATKKAKEAQELARAATLLASRTFT